MAFKGVAKKVNVDDILGDDGTEYRNSTAAALSSDLQEEHFKLAWCYRTASAGMNSASL